MLDGPEQCRDRHVAIVGGGDTAVDWALMAAESAKSVTLVHRRAAFRAHAATLDAARAAGVRIVVPHVLADIEGGDAMQRIQLQALDQSGDLELDCDLLISGLGFIADLGPIEQWGLQISDNRVNVSSAMESSIPGIFAAGDCAGYAGKVPLIASGFGEAATAVNNAALICDPAASLFPGHSTDRQLSGVPA